MARLAILRLFLKLMNTIKNLNKYIIPGLTAVLAIRLFKHAYNIGNIINSLDSDLFIANSFVMRARAKPINQKLDIRNFCKNYMILLYLKYHDKIRWFSRYVITPLLYLYLSYVCLLAFLHIMDIIKILLYTNRFLENFNILMASNGGFIPEAPGDPSNRNGGNMGSSPNPQNPQNPQNPNNLFGYSSSNSNNNLDSDNNENLGNQLILEQNRVELEVQSHDINPSTPLNTQILIDQEELLRAPRREVTRDPRNYRIIPFTDEPVQRLPNGSVDLNSSPTPNGVNLENPPFSVYIDIRQGGFINALDIPNRILIDQPNNVGLGLTLNGNRSTGRNRTGTRAVLLESVEILPETSTGTVGGSDTSSSLNPSGDRNSSSSSSPSSSPTLGST